MLDVNFDLSYFLYSMYKPGVPFFFYVIMVGGSALGTLIMLCSIWNGVRTKQVLIPLNLRDDVCNPYDVKIRTATQRERYMRTLTVLGANVVLIAMYLAADAQEIIYSLIVARHDTPFFGWLLTLGVLMPMITVVASLLMFVRVFFAPSPVKRVTIHASTRGEFILADPYSSRFGTPVRERKLRDPQPGDLHKARENNDDQ